MDGSMAMSAPPRLPSQEGPEGVPPPLQPPSRVLGAPQQRLALSQGAPAFRGAMLSTEDTVTCGQAAPLPAPAAPSQSLAAGAPPPPSQGEARPPSTGTFSETVIFRPAAAGQAPSQEVDACASTAFSGIMGHTNAISDECSSKGRAGSPSAAQSDGAAALPRPRPSKTVRPSSVHSHIPPGAGPPSTSSLNTTYCGAPSALQPCLSSPRPSRGGWALPRGGGLRGGAPLPGETSAISNGTTGWGPPPSAQAVSNSAGWGQAPSTQGGSAVSAWGSGGQDTSQQGPRPTSGAAQPEAPPQHYNLPSFPDEGQANSKMLNTHPPMVGGQPPQAPQPQAPGPGAPQPNTSWAAAAGKGLPPSEPATAATNGSTNKQLEQLNSVREALFSQDGWGGQNVKQDTSWDVGAPSATEPPPAAATAAQPTKADSMQWQAPSQSRNDGTDLWKSTLSGVPQQPKPAVATPWGNHTPTNPADYKNWGEDDGQGGNTGAEPQDSAMWNPRDAQQPPGAPQAQQPWDDRGGMGGPRGGFDDRGQRPDWGGAPKPKEDAMWGPSGGPGQWGGGGGGGDGPRGRGEPANWGPPPPGKPGAQGNWGAGGQGGGAPMQRGPQWDGDSPTMGRRFEDDGTSIWGQKESGRGPAPPGGWKDMPIPGNMGPRGPGGPGRMPAGPGMKDPSQSPWSQPHPGGQGRWDDGMGAGGAMWGAKEEARWADDGGWGAGGRPKPGPMRSSPSWEEPGMGGDRWGPRGGPGGVNKDMIWGSKQFRILCEMGFRKEDVETALRQTNLQLEDALEMLNAVGRGGGGMPGRGMPPSDMFGPRGAPDDMFGPRGFPGPGPGPMPPYPAGEIPPSNPGLTNPSRNINPGMMAMNGGGGPGGLHAPPRPQQNGPPSTSQLRVLVQQIQMAVQAGHLNPQILNQPLAPQTLLLLNQLLQQIKQLQNYQQQHAMAQAAGQRPGAPSSQALLGLTVQITKHKQQIQNLQNQITAQQAQYLKNQQPSQAQQGGAAPGPDDLLPAMGNMNMVEQPQGSKFLKLIGADKHGDEFPKAPGAPGSGRAPNSQSSPNLLLENNGPWSNVHGDAGWPSSQGDKPINTSTSEEDNFGIPEFVPGKAWKGTTLKDPSEDPTLTPGSVAPQPPSTVTTAENSLGLTSSTWSFNTATSKDSNPSQKEPWGNSGLTTSASATNLTAMGQDLWGQSRTSVPGKQQTPTTSGWPASNGLSSGSGWSNGTNGGMPSTPSAPVGQASSWLLLKNLTTQIDGSTLQTLCKQHGPLLNFHLYLPHGIALVKYSNGQEAKKAQNALNNCVLGNTTILAETTGEHEVEIIMRTISTGGQSQNQGPPASHRGSTPGTGFGGGYSSLAKSTSGDTWSAMSGGVSLGWPSTSSSNSSGLGGGVWGAPDADQHNRNTPLNSFLPNDLLAEGM